jgi:hypothetical protein
MESNEDNIHDDHDERRSGEERRHCSDKQCRTAREEWQRDVLLPKIRIEIAIMIGATVVFCASVFFYFNANAIRDYDLRVRDAASPSSFITQYAYERDVAAIRTDVASLKGAFRATTDTMIERLDRNFAEIREIKGKK